MKTPNFSLGPALDADVPALHALNQASQPHLSGLELDELRSLIGLCSHTAVARVESTIAGFVLALAPGSSYASSNYRWFNARYTRFIYIDRIAVAAPFQRKGIGAGLYEDVMRAADAELKWLTCEVNLDPPNPDSMSFHRRLGFVEVGRQSTEGGKKFVCLLAKPIRS